MTAGRVAPGHIFGGDVVMASGRGETGSSAEDDKAKGKDRDKDNDNDRLDFHENDYPIPGERPCSSRTSRCI